MKKKILSILLILMMSFAMISSMAIMASALEEQYDVTYGGTIGMNLAVNFSYTANPGEDYVFSFSSSDFYEPVNLCIYVNGVELSSDLWSYDKELRECVIYAEAITGDILIYADEKEIKAIPSVVDDVSFAEEDEITVEASFFLWFSDVSFDAPKLFEVVEGVEQNAKDTTFEYDDVSQNITVSYTFSKDDFSAGGTKTYKFGLLVDDEWYYTNEFTVTYMAKLVVTDDDKYNIPVGVRGTEVSVDLRDSVSGGVAPYTFTIDLIEGVNNWLNLSEEGIFYGTRPMHATGSFTVNVKVTDARGKTDTMWVLVEETVVEEHVCAENLLTEEENIPFDCETTGNIGYFICEICDTFYRDPLATDEITDKTSVIIPAGHNYGEKVEAQEAIHTADRLEAAVAAHYHCERCDKYFDESKNPLDSYEELKGTLPTHVYNVVNGYKGEDGHADACSCGAYDTANLIGHTDSCVDDDCTTENVCIICGYEIEKAHSVHTPREDDGDCMTPVLCGNDGCNKIAIEGKTEHTPKEGANNDCTVDVMCSVEGCTKVAIEGCADHTPEAQGNDCTVDRMCTVEGCEQVAIKGQTAHIPVDPHDDCTLDRLCVNCEQVAVEGNAEHKASEDDKNCTTATVCTNDGCKVTLVEAKTSHTPETDDGACTTDVKCSNSGCDFVVTEGLAAHVPSEDDGNCTTHVGCSNSGCNTVVIEAKEKHTPATDDGNCTTAVMCSVEGCKMIAVEAKAAHTDANNDGKCDDCGTETSTSTPSDDNKETDAPATDAPVVTDAPTTDKATETEKETDAPEKKGCGSAISLGGVAIIAIIGAGVTFAKRKED